VQELQARGYHTWFGAALADAPRGQPAHTALTLARVL
jgi:hypothetical protein